MHGNEAAQAAKKVTEVLFGKALITTLSQAELEVVKNNAPKSIVAEGVTLVDMLVETGLATSKREARTFIVSKAVSINEVVIEDAEAVVTKATHGTLCIIRKGKKSRVLVEIQ